jgi:hypothetical protein
MNTLSKVIGCLSAARQNIFKISMLDRFPGRLSVLRRPPSNKLPKNPMISMLSACRSLLPYGGCRATGKPTPPWGAVAVLRTADEKEEAISDVG